MTVKVLQLLLFIFFIASPLQGKSIEDFSFTDFNGTVYTAENLKGRPLVVNIASLL